jgi:hypothetical protein
VELAAPYGIYNWVSVSSDGALVTTSATAGPPEGVRVRIEPREGWTAEVTQEAGRIEVRLVKTPEEVRTDG